MRDSYDHEIRLAGEAILENDFSVRELIALWQKRLQLTKGIRRFVFRYLYIIRYIPTVTEVLRLNSVAKL